MYQNEFNFGSGITYTELSVLCSKEYERKSKKYLEKVDQLLYLLENKPPLDKIEGIVTSLNEVALDISALEPRWIEFSNKIMSYLLLTEKTSLSIVKELRSIFEELTNE